MNVAGTGMRVVVATHPVDFRKGHDGLAAVVEHELGLDPYSGVAVVFRPKRMDRMKVEPPRVSRRVNCLSQAAIADSCS